MLLVIGVDKEEGNFGIFLEICVIIVVDSLYEWVFKIFVCLVLF